MHSIQRLCSFMDALQELLKGHLAVCVEVHHGLNITCVCVCVYALPKHTIRHRVPGLTHDAVTTHKEPHCMMFSHTNHCVTLIAAAMQFQLCTVLCCTVFTVCTVCLPSNLCWCDDIIQLGRQLLPYELCSRGACIADRDKLYHMQAVKTLLLSIEVKGPAPPSPAQSWCPCLHKVGTKLAQSWRKVGTKLVPLPAQNLRHRRRAPGTLGGTSG